MNLLEFVWKYNRTEVLFGVVWVISTAIGMGLTYLYDYLHERPQQEPLQEEGLSLPGEGRTLAP